MRTLTPRSSRAAASAPSSPGCSSSLVRISSPAPELQPADRPGRCPRSCRSSAPGPRRRSRASRRRLRAAARSARCGVRSAPRRAPRRPRAPAPPRRLARRRRAAARRCPRSGTRAGSRTGNSARSPEDVHKPREYPHGIQAQHARADAAVGADRAGSRARGDDALHALGRRAPRAHTFADYEELWGWSVEELEQFWADIWEFCGVRASQPYERVLDRARCPARAGSRAPS